VPPVLRIAIDLRPLALGPLTGVGLVVRQILEELPLRGCGFVGVSDRPVPGLPMDLPVMVAPGRGRIRWETRVLPGLLRRIHPPPDLYHATWNHGIPRGLPFPSVVTIHDLIPWMLPRAVPWPSPAWLHRLLYRRAVRAAARAAAVVVTVSETSRRDIAERIPEAAGRSVVVPNALPRWFAPAPGSGGAFRERFGGRPYWLYLGGFDPRKGIDTLLEAMSRLPAGRTPLPDLVLAGALNDHARACEADARRRGLRVHFPGYVADSDLAALFAGASLFVYPSLYEGFGIPVLFAMAAGVPCVVSLGGSLPEVAAEAGLAFPAGDAASLAVLLERAVREPESFQPIADRGPGRARLFSVDALAERMIRVYERAAGRRAGSA